MARGRMISKAISLDEKVGTLSDDTARLLFTWLITHLDCEGRLHGDALTVKSIVFPRRSISPRKVEGYLKEMEKLGLVLRYSINGNTYLFAYHFEKHQTGLNKNREGQSQIPPPTQELLQSNSGKTPTEVKVKVKVKVKDPLLKKRGDNKSPSPFADDLKTIFEGLKTRRNWDSPKAAAEAKAMKWMLGQGYTTEQILGCYDHMRQDKWWKDKALYLMSVQGQIGEWSKGNGTTGKYTTPEDYRARHAAE